MKPDGSKKTRINRDNAQYINVVGDDLYYLNDTNRFTDNVEAPIMQIIKMKKNGKERKVLFTGPIDNFIVADGWMYFIDMSVFNNGFLLSKMNLSGKDRVMPAKDCSNIGMYWLKDDYLYYCANSMDGHEDDFIGGSIYRIKLDGSAKVKINNDSSYSMGIYGDRIYYHSDSNGDEQDSVYSIKLDGTNKVRVANESLSFFRIYKNRIYFVDYTRRLYSTKLDGSQRLQLYKDEMNGVINIVNDWIYIYSNTHVHGTGTSDGMDLTRQEGDRILRIQLDGSKQQRVFSD